MERHHNNTFSLHDALPISIINKHCLMHRCLLEPRFVKWSKPRQAPWGLILVWHWHMLRLSPVSTLQPFLLQTRSRSEEHTSELQSRFDLVCRLLLEKKKEDLP